MSAIELPVYISAEQGDTEGLRQGWVEWVVPVFSPFCLGRRKSDIYSEQLDIMVKAEHPNEVCADR